MMVKLLYALTILSFVISGCASNTMPNQDTSISVGNVDADQNYLSIRIDWIKIKGETGDLIGNGELFFDLIVVRENGDSRQLRAPGEGSYKVTNMSEIQMDGFSLNVNNIQPNEKVLVYFLAFDSDEPNFLTTQTASIAMDGAITVLGDGLKNGALFGKAITHSNLIGFILSQATDMALDWWKEADILGGHATVLSSSNIWMIDHSYEISSDNGVVTIHYTVTSSDPKVFQELAQDRSLEALPVKLNEPETISTPVTISYTGLGNCSAVEPTDQEVSQDALSVFSKLGTSIIVSSDGVQLKPNFSDQKEDASYSFYSMAGYDNFILEVSDEATGKQLLRYPFSRQGNAGKIVWVFCDLLTKSIINGMESSFRDEFNQPMLSDSWTTASEPEVSVRNGMVHLESRLDGNTNLILVDSIETSKGIYAEFKFSDSASFFMVLRSFDYKQPDSRYLFGLYGGPLYFARVTDDTQYSEKMIVPLESDFRVKPDEWYALELILNDPNTYQMLIWPRNNPSETTKYVWNVGDDWTNRIWNFSIFLLSESGSLDIDYVEKFEIR